MEPTQVTFRISSSYGIRSAREAHDWFLRMMQGHEEFEVETDEPGELPMPFCSETVRWVMVEQLEALDAKEKPRIFPAIRRVAERTRAGCYVAYQLRTLWLRPPQRRGPALPIHR